MTNGFNPGHLVTPGTTNVHVCTHFGTMCKIHSHVAKRPLLSVDFKRKRKKV